jgi:two-component sensor histidine kinase
VAIAVASLAAWMTGLRLIERPIRRFVDTAQRRAAGDLTAHFPEGRQETEFGRLGSALNVMAAEIDRLVDQKNLLLREVQHRVMNSLQLLSAFIHLQARQVSNEEVRRHLADTRERIVSLSAIYRHLYHSEATSTVDFDEALRALCIETARAYLGSPHLGTGDPAITVDAEPIELPVDTALNLALITHELLTNALKHAYDGDGGPLRVELRRRDDMLELAVIDEGKGLPPDFTFKGTTSLGMTVIRTLTRQLRGTVTTERQAKGAHFIVRIPLRDIPRLA